MQYPHSQCSSSEGGRCRNAVACQRVGKHVRELAGVLRPVVRVQRQSLSHDFATLSGRPAREPAADALASPRRSINSIVCSSLCRLVGKHFIGNDWQRVDIRAPVNRPCTDLLSREISRRTPDTPPRATAGLCCQRDPEIGQEGASVGVQ